jgi:hypothetical protein
MTLEEALAHPRVAIVGRPDCGKSKLAEKCAGYREVIHTDDFKHIDYSLLGVAISGYCSSKTSFLLEGVRAAHALRAGLEVDVAIWLDTPFVDEPSPGQIAIGKGARTVWDQWIQLDGGVTPILEVENYDR